MTTYSEQVYLGDVVKFELPMHFCRKVETIKLQAGATVAPVIGECLEPDGVKKKIVAVGGNCDSILLENITLADHKAADQKCVCLIRGPAIVDTDQLACNADQKATAVAALLVLGILVRSEPTYTTL